MWWWKKESFIPVILKDLSTSVAATSDESEVVIEDIRSWNGESADVGRDTTSDATSGLSNARLHSSSSKGFLSESDFEVKHDPVDEVDASLQIHPEADASSLFSADSSSSSSVFGTDNEVSFSLEGGVDFQLLHLNEAFSGKISALLTLEPTNCFVPNSEEQKLFHSVMYDLARQMVATADVVRHGPNSPMHREHFKKNLDEFLNAYLADFLARVPEDFRVNKKGRVFTPMAIIRKCCNDCFRALLRRKFRQACLAANTPVPFTFH